ncbi:MAG: hypothetical protein ACP59X_18320 [Solidesulfovibrio sp. DCME]|uniref:hypothetical protein n=1 Tax=Solidesulfovibrio sp. DCME TaxID=3447380 RepID=UPI003D0AA666
MTRKCLWDESHTYESNGGEDYRHLCPACYFNIYKNLYSDKYQWHDFLKNIETIKIEHKINELKKELALYEQKLKPLNGNSKTVEVECLFCGEAFKVDPKETWRYACNDCFKTFVVPLRQLYDQKTIRTLISAFKEDHGGEYFELEDVLKFAKEYFNNKTDD